MRDSNTFQPEAFPLEVLAGESDELTGAVGEYEEERRGGGSRRSAAPVRRSPPRRRPPVPPQRPRPPRWPWPRPQFPHVPWPYGGGGVIVSDAAFAPQPACPPQVPCTCPVCAASAQPDSAAADEPSPDAGATPEPADNEQFLGDIAGRIGGAIGGIAGRIGDALSEAEIIDLTARADRTHRKGTRDMSTVKSLVLHQMACCFKPRDPLTRFLSIVAHFAITEDGRILQLHPLSALLWASNGFNGTSVAVEFAGNFPDTRGRWWKGDTFGKNRPTPAQVVAGRKLIRYLMGTMGLTTVLAHRQSSATRENDPGPDIWYDVGQWAVSTLGLSDGGSGFTKGDGKPIPEEWRTWGARRPATTPEIAAEQELAMAGSEGAHHTPCGCRRCAGSQQGRWIRQGREVVLLGA